MSYYLSIVMGVGGEMTDDLLDRLNSSILNLHEYAEFNARELVDFLEVVIVQWNAVLPVQEWWFTSHVPIRIIRVPPELHEKVPNPHCLRYFEWYPKNIGIRRARGEFVVSTNPDDFFSAGLLEYFFQRELQHGHFYRVNRHDLNESGIYRVCYPTGCKPGNATLEEIRKPETNACSWSPDMIHYNASGDFTLMSKEDWFLIHGNPEREYSHTIDGQTLYLAHLKGLKQIVLPYAIYHSDHPRTLNVVDGKVIGPEWDDNKPFTKENGEDWGFAGMEFKETLL